MDGAIVVGDTAEVVILAREDVEYPIAALVEVGILVAIKEYHHEIHI